jgi:GLPGLI family protein
MKKLLLLTLVLATAAYANAQQFITRGKIEFERKINVHKQFEGDGEWIQEIKKSIPQYDVTYFDFYFDGNKSVYKPGRENPDARGSNMGWNQGPARENVIHTNYETQSFIGQKQVFETTYLIQDSLRKIEWKYTTDTRKIAGFNCRKATGIIMDSVYIFAFFTDEIMVTGGPEGFNGLPGMILGIAIPRIHTTWFATKLQLVDVTAKDLAAPTKGKKTTIPDLEKSLQSSLKDWGKWANRNIWNIML